MRVEIRGDSVTISGYVNAVERFSKPIREVLNGKVTTFIERIQAGTFKTALTRNDDVKVLLNHDANREIASTGNGSATLVEDSIGLRAEFTTDDADVVEKARNNKLVGWSFGFYANDERIGSDDGNTTRTVTDLDLIEVSVLDDSKSPAYNGTSIETRGRTMETRDTLEDIEKEAQAKHEAINQEADQKFKEVNADTDAIIDQEIEQHQAVELEADRKKYEFVAELIANKILDALGKGKVEETKDDEQDDEKVEEQIDNTETETDDEKKEESRAIDYSKFENIINSF